MDHIWNIFLVVDPLNILHLHLLKKQYLTVNKMLFKYNRHLHLLKKQY